MGTVTRRTRRQPGIVTLFVTESRCGDGFVTQASRHPDSTFRALAHTCGLLEFGRTHDYDTPSTTSTRAFNGS